VLDIHDLISKDEPDDVRWATVKQLKLILAQGTYAVPTEQVAARLIGQMMESGRSRFRGNRKLTSKTNARWGSARHLLGQAETNDLKAGRVRASEAITSK
jgi:hypothetical protein